VPTPGALAGQHLHQLALAVARDAAMPRISPPRTLSVSPRNRRRPASLSAARSATSSRTSPAARGVALRRLGDALGADHHRRHLLRVEGCDGAAADLAAAAQHRDRVANAITSRNLCVIIRMLIWPLRARFAQEAEHLVGLVGRQHRGRLVEDEERRSR